MSTRVSRPSEAAALILGLARPAAAGHHARSVCEIVSVQTNPNLEKERDNTSARGAH